MSFGNPDPPLPNSSQIQTDIKRAGFRRIQRMITFLQDHRKNYGDVDMLLDLAETRFNEYVRPECDIIKSIRLELHSETEFPVVINLSSGKQVAECLDAQNSGMSLADYVEMRWHPQDWIIELERGGFAPTVSFVKGKPTTFVPVGEGETFVRPAEGIGQFSSELESLRIGQERLEEGQQELRRMLGGKILPSTPEAPKREEKQPQIAHFRNISWADLKTIRDWIGGHRVIFDKTSKTSVDVQIKQLPFESNEAFQKWKQQVEEKIEERRGIRRMRAAEAFGKKESKYALHISSSGERAYAETVNKRLGAECYDYRIGDMVKRKKIQDAINYALDTYFGIGNEEASAVGHEIDWDYMDGALFPVGEICRIVAEPKEQQTKLDEIGEIVNEFSRGEGGFRF